MENLGVGALLIHADRCANGHDKTLAAFHNCENVPKNLQDMLVMNK